MKTRCQRESSGDVVRAGKPDIARPNYALGVSGGEPVLERRAETGDVVGDRAPVVRWRFAQDGAVLGRNPFNRSDASRRELARVRKDTWAKDRGALAHSLVGLNLGEADNWVVGLVLGTLAGADGRRGAGGEHVELALRSSTTRKHLSIVELCEKFG